MAYNQTHKIRIKDLKSLAIETKEKFTTLDSRTSLLTIDQAGMRNCIYRGQNLGAFTAAHLTSIRRGTFDDMFIGDYFTHGGVIDIIAGFAYTGVSYTQYKNTVIMLRGTPFKDDSKFAPVYNRWPEGTEGEEGYDAGTYGKYYPESNWYTAIRPYFIENIESIYGADACKTFILTIPTGMSGYTPTGWARLVSKAHLPTIAQWGGIPKYLLNSNTAGQDNFNQSELPLHRHATKCNLNNYLFGMVLADRVDLNNGYAIHHTAGKDIRNILDLYPATGLTNPDGRFYYKDGVYNTPAVDEQKICPLFVLG